MEQSTVATARWRRGALSLIAVLAILGFASSPVGAHEGGQLNDGPHCANGHFCYWFETYYGGALKVVYSDIVAGVWVAGELPIRSAKNKFGNRRVQVKGLNGFIRCLNPGEVAPVMSGLHSWKIGIMGSRC